MQLGVVCSHFIEKRRIESIHSIEGANCMKGKKIDSFIALGKNIYYEKLLAHRENYERGKLKIAENENYDAER